MPAYNVYCGMWVCVCVRVYVGLPINKSICLYRMHYLCPFRYTLQLFGCFSVDAQMSGSISTGSLFKSVILAFLMIAIIIIALLMLLLWRIFFQRRNQSTVSWSVSQVSSTVFLSCEDVQWSKLFNYHYHHLFLLLRQQSLPKGSPKSVVA